MIDKYNWRLAAFVYTVIDMADVARQRKGKKMKKSDRNIARVFAVIERNLSKLEPMGYDRVTDSIIKLCELIQCSDTTEDTWYIGEHGEFALDSLIAGAFWHYTEWHRGQYSKEY